MAYEERGKERGGMVGALFSRRSRGGGGGGEFPYLN